MRRESRDGENILYPAKQGKGKGKPAAAWGSTKSNRRLSGSCGVAELQTWLTAKHPLISVSALVGSCSFAMRFTFVLVAASSKPPQQPKERGVLGSCRVARVAELQKKALNAL
jgi:hypothetical protein